MRVILVAVAALLWVSTAAAALPPPGYHPTITIERTSGKESLKTCTASVGTRRAKTQKRLVTTACEQPPRPNVKDLGGFYWFTP